MDGNDNNDERRVVEHGDHDIEAVEEDSDAEEEEQILNAVDDLDVEELEEEAIGGDDDYDDDDNLVAEENEDVAQIENHIQHELGPGRLRNYLYPAFLRRVVRRVRRHWEHEDSDADEEAVDNLQQPESITFDKNLPTCHTYLGDMEECSGIAYQDQDTYITLSILHIPDFVLIPGQTLPLQITRLGDVAMIREVMQQDDKTFGVLTTKYVVDANMTHRKESYNVGCTAEIRSFRDEEEFQVVTLRFVAMGRQRFKVMEKRTQLNGNVIAKVKIISDVELPGVVGKVETCHNCRAELVGGQPKTSILLEKYRRHAKVLRRAAMFSAWPASVHKMYDVNFLKMAIFAELREWNQKLQESQCPERASDFSFWVITMLPIRDQTRLNMLQLESAEQRLRMILNMLRKRTAITCSGCSALVANRRDVFSMSSCGPMAAYVNPGGVVHETLTLYKAKGLNHVGRKSTEHSWFPGYAWTICECARCYQHMGWKFSAVKSDLTPKVFWGLTRSSLVPAEPGAIDQQADEADSSNQTFPGRRQTFLTDQVHI